MKNVLCFGDSNTYGYDPAGMRDGTAVRYAQDVRWCGVAQRDLHHTRFAGRSCGPRRDNFPRHTIPFCVLQSSLAPAALTTCAQRPTSALTKLANCACVMPP